MSIPCSVFFSQRPPLRVGMPASSLRVLTMLSTLRPASVISKMRRTTASAGGSSSNFGRSLAPSLHRRC